MSSLEKILIERWYNIILLLGVGLVGSSFMFDINFLNKKHLIGLGIGMILVGLSLNIARKYFYTRYSNGLMQEERIVHTWYTKLMLIDGVIIIAIFLTLLIKNLI
jgi:hypothetical protein